MTEVYKKDTLKNLNETSEIFWIYYEQVNKSVVSGLCSAVVVNKNLNFSTIQLRLLLLIIIDDMRKFE